MNKDLRLLAAISQAGMRQMRTRTNWPTQAGQLTFGVPQSTLTHSPRRRLCVLRRSYQTPFPPVRPGSV